MAAAKRCADAHRANRLFRSACVHPSEAREVCTKRVAVAAEQASRENESKGKAAVATAADSATSGSKGCRARTNKVC